MIVPSIDLIGGEAVQLIGGKEMALNAGDPRPLARRFSLAGEIAVIDLDAAMGSGSNREVISDLLRIAPCRVGGGVRDAKTALDWLDAGAAKVIIGTKAEPELLSQLPRERVIAALDAVEGEVVVDGWRTKTGRGIVERMVELRDYVGGFLVTFVEREGRLQGTDLGRVAELVEAAGTARVTIAGGVTTAAEIRQLDDLGADAQVGMALYTGRLPFAEAITAPLTSDRPDGLWPTVVADESGRALGLAWSNSESIAAAVEALEGVYFSRKRGLWHKGKTSGDTQELLRIDLDCDRDALRFTVVQRGKGFCHLGTRSCWGEEPGLGAVYRRLAAVAAAAPSASYTQKLLRDKELLAGKIREEAEELIQATDREHIIHEAADVFYFSLVRLVRDGIDLAEVEAELHRRFLKVSRRGGELKQSPRAE